MKNEPVKKENNIDQQGFPIQAVLMLAVIGFAVIALIVKISGIL